MTRIFDVLLGRTSMYRLVLNALLVLGLAAFVLALTGNLSFGAVTDTANPARSFPTRGLGLSLLVLLVATIGSNALFALLFRVKAHPESSFITAVLLWFILLPTGDPKLLLQTALAGVIASASKYVFAIRGRHIFNPAAFGAFWMLLTQFNVVGIWWVGTPVLVVLAAVLGFLVLYRTRRLQLGGVFIIVALAVTLVPKLFDNSLSFSSELYSAVLQSPLIFFACFMLSEPLTLPPTRCQQLLVAVIVGVVYAVPKTIGVYSFGVEVALLVGNLVAFAFGQRAAIRLTLLERSNVAGRAVEFAFRPTRPLKFAAGQYIELSVPHAGADRRGSRRVFSIASPQRDADRLVVAMTATPEVGSTFKNSLMKMKVGTEIGATGISGDFVFPSSCERPLLLIAGGIGITPFLGQLDGLAGGSRFDVVLVYVQKHPADLAYLDLLDSSRARVIVASASPAQDLPSSFENVITDRLQSDDLAVAVPDIARRDVYISGPPGFVDDIASISADLGARRIRRDHFAGY